MLVVGNKYLSVIYLDICMEKDIKFAFVFTHCHVTRPTPSSRQQMHPQNTVNILAGPDIKPRTVGESQAKAN